MKNKLFLHVVINVLLVAVICCVSAVGLVGATTNVFGKDSCDPIYRGTGNNVALMINVYWGTEFIDDLLNILQKSGARATFFVGGHWVAQNPEILKKICEAGHEIGNHGYYHKQHSKLTYSQNVDEISTCNKLIFEICGKMPVLFAPPSGDFSQDTLKAAGSCGCRTIMWTRDTIDWRDNDSNLIFTRATKNVCGGELILMHPTQHTLAALPKMVQHFLDNNFNLVTVSEIIGEQ